MKSTLLKLIENLFKKSYCIECRGHLPFIPYGDERHTGSFCSEICIELWQLKQGYPVL